MKTALNTTVDAELKARFTAEFVGYGKLYKSLAEAVEMSWKSHFTDPALANDIQIEPENIRALRNERLKLLKQLEDLNNQEKKLQKQENDREFVSEELVLDEANTRKIESGDKRQE